VDDTDEFADSRIGCTYLPDKQMGCLQKIKL